MRKAELIADARQLDLALADGDFSLEQAETFSDMYHNLIEQLKGE